MTGEALISVIVPIYNIEDHLPRCLETIAAQTYRNLEIILVDDGSTDRSGAICDGFATGDGRARVIHQANQGLSGARNSGKRAATGGFLFFVDGDDYLHRDAVRVLYEALAEAPGCDLAIMDFTNTDTLDGDTAAQGDNPTTILDRKSLIENMFCHEESLAFIYVWNKLYRKELLQDIWNEDYPRTEDFDYNFRVYLKTRQAAWVRRPLYFYVNRPTSIVHCRETLPVYFKSKTALLEDNLVSLPAGCSEFAHLLVGRLFEVLLQWIGFNWDSGKRQEVLGECRRTGRKWLRKLWQDGRIPLHKKLALTVNLYFPGTVRWAKRVSRDRLHWPSTT